LAGPLNGAEIPNRISVSVTPQTVGAGALGGGALASCGLVAAAGAAALGALGCATRGATGAAGTATADALASCGGFEFSAVCVLDAGDLPVMAGSPAMTSHPMPMPNVRAIAKPAANHPSRRPGWGT